MWRETEMNKNKKKYLSAIKALFMAIKKADEISTFKFDSTVETVETPTRIDSILEPTGWINVDIHIRFYRKHKFWG